MMILSPVERKRFKQWLNDEIKAQEVIIATMKNLDTPEDIIREYEIEIDASRRLLKRVESMSIF